MKHWSLIVIAFLLAAWCYQQHEHVNFNYEGSVWQSLDDKLPEPFFKNNSRPELKSHPVFQFMPFTWDGYHMFAWLMKYFFWLAFAISYYFECRNVTKPVAVGLVVAISDLILSNLTYGWFFV